MQNFEKRYFKSVLLLQTLFLVNHLSSSKNPLTKSVNSLIVIDIFDHAPYCPNWVCWLYNVYLKLKKILKIYVINAQEARLADQENNFFQVKNYFTNIMLSALSNQV